MHFVILRLLKHNELGMFHAYRRLGKEVAKQRAINFDAEVVVRVFPAAKRADRIELSLRYETDASVQKKDQWIKRQEKNWRMEGNCPKDDLYQFVRPGCLFAMIVDSGVRPAVGAWAVFSADDPVTRTILANPESCDLTSNSMVALHGDEGSRTLALLQQAKPHLFEHKESPVGDRDQEPGTRQQSPGGPHLPPDPKRLVNILASVGHTLPSAVADIVDNSISKDATEIHITFGRPDSGHGRWMTITDNGIGMNQDRLAEAMRIGSEAVYGGADLGKFGYGLKGASWSQTKRFTVISRQAKGPVHHLTWDADNMTSWVASNEPLAPWIATATTVGEHGTCVFWENMRPPLSMPTAKGTDPFTAEVAELERHLGLVFHRFLDGKASGRRKVTVFINGTRVISNDPVGHPRVAAYDQKQIRVPVTNGNALVQVRAYLLPSEDEIKALHGPDTIAARQDLDRIGMYGRRNESQGIYVYRNNRLIQWGGWHQIWGTVDEKTKLARVTVDFGSDLDDLLSVNISKQQVKLSQQLQTEIKKIADVARKDSQRKFRPAKPQTTTTTGASGRTASVQSGAPGEVAPGAQPNKASSVPAEKQTSVRSVRTTAFAWKLNTGLTGGQEIQVSASEVELAALANAISEDQGATRALASFLERLDRAAVQATLLTRKGRE